MKKPARGSGGRRGQHPDDDEAMWEPGGRNDQAAWAQVARACGGGGEVRDPARRPAAKRAPARHHAPYSPPAPPAPVKVPPLADFDERHAKKIRSGRVEIERRVDLHGMRRNEAHAMLRRFLFECHEQGRRCVLVITGKGGPRRQRDEDSFGWGNDEPGILKREVPRWLAEPDLRAIVVSFTAAAVQHGGEGALYVHLRRIGRSDERSIIAASASIPRDSLCVRPGLAAASARLRAAAARQSGRGSWSGRT